MKIKFGVKIWSVNTNTLDQAEELLAKDIFQYIELMAIPGTEIEPFKRIRAKYIVHAIHEGFDFNAGDANKEEMNLSIFREAMRWKKELKAKYLIVHLGYGKFSSTKSFLAKIKGKGVLIENMPRIGEIGKEMIGSSPEEIKELKMGKKFGFCLDFGHAIKSAIFLKKDYKEYVERFLEFKPQVIHITDGSLAERDEHLSIGQGQYDFNFLAECIKANNGGYVTLETARENLNSLEEDSENLKKIKNYLSLK